MVNIKEHADQTNEKLQIIIFLGELEAARASNVLQMENKIFTKKNKSLLPQHREGLLVVTNFRLCFLISQPDNNDKTDMSKKNVHYQENKYLGRFDITLSNIDEVSVISDKKQKVVTPQQKNSWKNGKIDAIRIGMYIH